MLMQYHLGLGVGHAYAHPLFSVPVDDHHKDTTRDADPGEVGLAEFSGQGPSQNDDAIQEYEQSDGEDSELEVRLVHEEDNSENEDEDEDELLAREEMYGN